MLDDRGVWREAAATFDTDPFKPCANNIWHVHTNKKIYNRFCFAKNYLIIGITKNVIRDENKHRSNTMRMIKLKHNSNCTKARGSRKTMKQNGNFVWM